MAALLNRKAQGKRKERPGRPREKEKAEAKAEDQCVAQPLLNENPGRSRDLFQRKKGRKREKKLSIRTERRRKENRKGGGRARKHGANSSRSPDPAVVRPG